MASGSGKNQDDTETKEPVDSPRQSEESSAAAAAAATESPPIAPESEINEEEVHGPPEAGGRNPSASAAEKKAEEISLFWSAWGSAGDRPPLPPRRPSVAAGGKPPLPPRPPSVSRDRGSSSANIDLEDVFNELMLEVKEKSGETDQKDEAEQMPRQQDEQAESPALRPKKGKNLLRRKVLDRIGISNQKYTLPHVNYEKVHIAELIRHYNLLEMVAGRGVLFHSHALMLRRAYSAFRPVNGDGECFYRSFIFSYLEQVLDRQDTHEEHRVLAAVKGVARQHARLGWATEFSRSHKDMHHCLTVGSGIGHAITTLRPVAGVQIEFMGNAFKKLIKKVMRWKTHRRWKHVPTVNSYRIEKLLEFFNNNKRTVDIFTFLRLVAAIWICSHSEEFAPLIPELNEGHTLTEWCFQEVIQRKVFTDHIQITALLGAIRVPLRVEYLFQEAGQDLYTGQGSKDDMPRSTCWPRHHHQVPPDHEVPHVTLLYTQEHYDIIYPYHPDGLVTSGEWEESTATATEPPPIALQSEITEEEVHGPPETGIREQNEKVKPAVLWPKKGKKPLCKKWHFSTPRNMMIVIVLVLSISLLPAQIVSFQHFDSIEDAAERLATVNGLADLRLQLAEETAVPRGVGFCFHPVMIVIYAFLVMRLLSWFIGPEER